MTNKLTQNTIEGVLVFVSVQQPTTKYQSTDKEYKASVVVDEDTADAWNEMFGKQPAKVVKTTDFKDTYKIDAPFPNEKKQYVINLKKPAQYADGNPLPKQYQPKVFLQNGNTATDVTDTQLPANGSYGKISFESRSNDFGTFAKLKNVLVSTMIEYKKSGGSGASDFGLVATGVEDFTNDSVQQEVTKQPVGKTNDDEYDSDSIPF